MFIFFQGRLENGQRIVVKRFHSYSQQVIRECKNEISLLAKLEHDNLVQLLGYCVEGTQMLLIYALAIYASLDLLMFGITALYITSNTRCIH